MTRHACLTQEVSHSFIAFEYIASFVVAGIVAVLPPTAAVLDASRGGTYVGDVNGENTSGVRLSAFVQGAQYAGPSCHPHTSLAESLAARPEGQLVDEGGHFGNVFFQTHRDDHGGRGGGRGRQVAGSYNIHPSKVSTFIN
jgi:hypothetical protein